MTNSEQLAGAVGTALFVSVMTQVSCVGASSGMDHAAAQLQGVHSALLWGVWISAAALLLSFALGRHQQQNTTEA